jgi:hypothetical protein
MSEQMDLLSWSETAAQADAQVLARWLYLEDGWRTRKEIAAALGWSDHARIRHAAEAAEGDVIFGQRGMRHILHASPEEFAACVATMKSQVEAQQRRIIATEKKYHGVRGQGVA